MLDRFYRYFVAKKTDYYWDDCSEIIGRLLKSICTKSMSICEIGFSGGHYLEWLNDNGYMNLSGVEVRKDQFDKTFKKFQSKKLNIQLFCGNILDFSENVDCIFSTGLLQCLNESDRYVFLTHISEIAPLALFTVPEILNDRNIGSGKEIGVSGCVEYKTSNILYEISQFYDLVRVGKIDKKNIGLSDSFIYYIARKNKS